MKRVTREAFERMEAIVQAAISTGLAANGDSGYRSHDWVGPDKQRQARLLDLRLKAARLREEFGPQTGSTKND